ncbi:RNA-guided endonuclease InsQ/TnpB family protein [Litorivivens sp.]|uniref:RNA-guided endonuclease InsQ/TnpB family protein n=1 Tax=Litorivivens sp. TaxID=2020868 RepID=UPI003567A80A
MDQQTVVKVNIGHPDKRQTELRLESARLWNRLVRVHKFCRKKQWDWPSKGQLEKHYKGRFNLHSQTIQAIIGKFIANVDTASALRKSGDKRARYPWRDRKRFQVVMWKGQSIRRKGNRVILPSKSGEKKLSIRIPQNLPPGKITQAELGYRELRLTIKQTHADVESAGENQVNADLGIIHFAAMTDGVDAEIIVGRGLRSLTQNKNRKLGIIQRKLSKTAKGSRQTRKLRKSKARLLSKYENQKHNFLHHAANAMIDYCKEREAGTLVVGDCIDMARNKRKETKGSRRLNQENSGNPLGQLISLLKYKGARNGVEIHKQNESYTTQTCPKCGHRYKPSGRMYICRKDTCDFIGIRDIVGASNIGNKFQNGGKIVPSALVPPLKAKYLRVIKMPVARLPVVDGLAGRKLLDTTLLQVSCAEAQGANAPMILAETA